MKDRINDSPRKEQNSALRLEPNTFRTPTSLPRPGAGGGHIHIVDTRQQQNRQSNTSERISVPDISLRLIFVLLRIEVNIGQRLQMEPELTVHLIAKRLQVLVVKGW